MARCQSCVEAKLREIVGRQSKQLSQARMDIAMLEERVRRLMHVSQHCLSEQEYLAEVGLYKKVSPTEYIEVDNG